jgi:hypothetical protein
MDHPTSGNKLDTWVFSYPPLVVHNLQPYNSQYSRKRFGVCYLEECVIPKIVINGNLCVSLYCSLDKWSATKFSTPFLSLISMSNSWSKRIHQINRGLASFLVRRYLRAAWSV